MFKKGLLQSQILEMIQHLKLIDETKYRSILDKIKQAFVNSKTVFVCGNGGSAANSNHLFCDFLKSIADNSKYKPKIFSLVTNIEFMTAISNDKSFKDIFSYQLDRFGSKKDLLVIFSVSGASSNLINVLKVAKKKKIFIISFLGKKNTPAYKLSNLSINVESGDYGIVENVHQFLMHSICKDFMK
jgi:D-sedoheptulose 7-phosphate isomerase